MCVVDVVPPRRCTYDQFKLRRSLDSGIEESIRAERHIGKERRLWRVHGDCPIAAVVSCADHDITALCAREQLLHRFTRKRRMIGTYEAHTTTTVLERVVHGV